MHLLSVGQVLCGGQGKSRSDDTLNGSIVGQVHEEDDTVHRAVDLEVGLEEKSGLLGDTHSGKNNGEVLVGVIVDVLVLDEGGLTTDLGADFVVRKTGSGEERNFLTTSDGVHDIDSGNTGLDHLLGVLTLEGVDWLTLCN